MRRLQGIIPVKQTFFNKDGSVDEKTTSDHLKYLSSLDIGGLWVLGTGSEDMNLSFSKRIKIAKIVTKENNGKVPLMLGCSFFCMDDMFKFIDETGDLNFDAYHMMPYHPLLSLKRLTYIYEKLADFSMSKFNKPLWLYSSANWSRKIDYNFILNLSKKKGICGIKFSTSNSPDQVKALQLNSKNFQVITAVMKQTLPNLISGTKAFTSSVGGVIPEAIIKLYNSYLNKNYKKALFYQREINNLLDSFPKNLKKDNFLGAAEEKYILKLRGLGNGKVSSYYREPTVAEKKIIKNNVYKFFKNLGILKDFKIKTYD